jgi:D-alanyl-D-alanine dipeptidase
MNVNDLNHNFSKKEYDFVEFTDQINYRIKICPMYFNLGFSSSPLVFGRYAVLHRLYQVITLLPEQYGIIIWDVYRPRAVQAKLFNWMKEEIRKKSPDLTDQENILEATKYMSAPSKVGDLYCPPHLSGGAIDLTLYDTLNGKPIDMGTEFDDCTEKAHIDYFNKRIILSTDEEKIKGHRKLLRDAMETAGFTSYQYEWWHFDIGNIFWSKQTNYPEVFGPLFGDEEFPKNL